MKYLIKRRGFLIVLHLSAVVLAVLTLIWLFLRIDGGSTSHLNWLTTKRMAEAAIALEVFRSVHEGYPCGDDWAVVLPRLASFWIDVPKEDAWRQPFVYVGSEAAYSLASCGADKVCSGRQSGSWISGDYDQDIVIEDGRWAQVRGAETHADISVGITRASRRVPQLGGIEELVFSITSDREAPLGLQLDAYIIGLAEWSGGRAEYAEEFRDERAHVGWQISESTPGHSTEVHAQATIRGKPVCFLVLGLDRQHIEENFKNNVDSWCLRREAPRKSPPSERSSSSATPAFGHGASAPE